MSSPVALNSVKAFKISWKNICNSVIWLAISKATAMARNPIIMQLCINEYKPRSHGNRFRLEARFLFCFADYFYLYTESDGRRSTLELIQKILILFYKQNVEF